MTTHQRTAVLFRTHFWDDFAQRQFDRLLSVADGTDVFVLVDETSGPVVGIPHDKVVRLTEQRTLDMGFARAGAGNLLWFNGDYPLYWFVDLYPGYDFYLQLEYDVLINQRLMDMIAQAQAGSVDFVGLTKGEPSASWFWRDSCAAAYAPEELRHQLICLSLFSRRALQHLWQRRLALSVAYRDGSLATWPFCEAFIPTELALGGFACRELSAFGDTAAYDHWPPYLENDVPRMQAHRFIHPVLDERRYTASLFKYHIGLAGYLNPLSLFHRKLRRLPVRRYLTVLASSFSEKASRKMRDKHARRRPGVPVSVPVTKGL